MPRRNDPCPCGSGKKHKVCCLRSGGKRAASKGEHVLVPAVAPADVPAIRPRPKPIEVEAERLGHPDAEPWRIKKIEAEALLAIEQAMAKLGEELAMEYGLVVRQQKQSYTEWNSKVEFEVAVKRDDGLVMTRLAESFLERCGDYGLLPSDLGRTFTADGILFRVTGLRPRAKAPILCEQLKPVPEQPVEFRFKPAHVRHWLHECTDQGAR